MALCARSKSALGKATPRTTEHRAILSEIAAPALMHLNSFEIRPAGRCAGGHEYRMQPFVVRSETVLCTPIELRFQRVPLHCIENRTAELRPDLRVALCSTGLAAAIAESGKHGGLAVGKKSQEKRSASPCWVIGKECASLDRQAHPGRRPCMRASARGNRGAAAHGRPGAHRTPLYPATFTVACGDAGWIGGELETLVSVQSRPTTQRCNDDEVERPKTLAHTDRRAVGRGMHSPKARGMGAEFRGRAPGQIKG